jgi:hypothetical protein
MAVGCALRDDVVPSWLSSSNGVPWGLNPSTVRSLGAKTYRLVARSFKPVKLFSSQLCTALAKRILGGCISVSRPFLGPKMEGRRMSREHFR